MEINAYLEYETKLMSIKFKLVQTFLIRINVSI